MSRQRRGEWVHYLYFNGVLIWVYSVYLSWRSWLNIYFSDHIIDMTFMDSEREIEREAHLREQANKMWEEAERRSEERRRWREANRQMTDRRYEKRKERTNIGKNRRRRRREHRYTQVNNARVPQIDLRSRLPPRRQCKCWKLFYLNYLRTVLCKRMQQLSSMMRPARKKMQRYICANGRNR